MRAFSPSLEELKSAIDAEVERRIETTRSSLPESAPLLDEILRMLRAGGKRLRPAFCYWGYRAGGGGHDDRIVRAASSLELLHTFAIVHDDIMDRSEERRGAPTVHAARGTELALLAGDLALVLADDTLMSSGFDPPVLLDAFATYSRMRREVIAGQLLDLEAAHEREVDETYARRVAVLKSGRYSIEGPLVLGATLAGAPAGLIEALARFARPLGEAFQLRDDLLGTFGDRSRLGKPVDSDIREGKRNVLYALTRDLLSGAERSFFVDRWGAAELSEREVVRLRELVESSGGRAETEALLARLAAESARALEHVVVESEVRTALETLKETATERAV